MEVKKNKKISIKKTFMVLFCFISISFLLFIGIFMGIKISRMRKLYLVSNLSDLVKEEYRGDVLDNYVLFSNRLFRVIKVNENHTVELILNEDINVMKNENMDVLEYVNEVFLDSIDKTLLTKSIICDDSKCEKRNIDNYVKLLEKYEYDQSFSDDKTYIEGNFWLGTSKDEDNTLVVTSDGVKYDKNNSSYGVRPVITLKNTVKATKGTGTKDDPFVVDMDETLWGSYIKLGNDLWVVYEEDENNLKLMLANLYNDGMFNYHYSLSSIKYDDKSEDTLAYYLNSTYYDSLSYKSKLLSFSVCTDEYKDSYKDICSSKEKVMVGIPTLSDLKFDNVNNYYLINGNGDEIYAISDGLNLSNVLISRNVRPTIMIKKPKFISGKGTITDPFVGEV